MVAAAVALAGVQRRVQADGDEGVLEEGAAPVVGVRVAGGDGAQAQLVGQLGQQPVAPGVAAPVGTLQLDAEPLAAEDAAQAAGVVGGFADAAGGHLARDQAVAGAAGQAVQAVGVEGQLVDRDRRCAAVGDMGQRQQPAEVAVAGGGLDQQRQVGAAGQGQLAAGDRPHAGVARGMRELERPGQAVVVGQRHGGVAELGGGEGQLLGLGGAVQERVAGVGVQLDHARCSNQRSRRRSQKTTVLRPSASTRS